MALLLRSLVSTQDKEQRGPVYDRRRRPVTVANCQFPAHLPSLILTHLPANGIPDIWIQDGSAILCTHVRSRKFNTGKRQIE